MNVKFVHTKQLIKRANIVTDANKKIKEQRNFWINKKIRSLTPNELKQELNLDPHPMEGPIKSQ